MTETLNKETGELTRDPEPDAEPAQAPDAEPEPDPEGRCEAETTAGGTPYRCALQANHDGDHFFQPEEDETPEASDSEKGMARASKSLELEAARHTKRLQEIMGDDFHALTRCELCFPLAPGYRWDASPNEQTVAAVRVAIGMPDLSNFRPSATEHTCDDCAGLGKVRTGSSVPRHEVADCDACKGKGYMGTRERLNTPPPDAPPAVNGDAPPAAVDDGIKRDMFGTPETDPDYGLMPNMRARPTEYWQTNRV